MELNNEITTKVNKKNKLRSKIIYERYEIFENGNIVDLLNHTSKIKTRINRNVMFCKLMINGVLKELSLPRLVAINFLENKNNDLHVFKRNKCATDNCVSNLMWGKPSKEKSYNNCLSCDKSTLNAKFCTRSCAAVFNNKHFIKRRRKKFYCIICNSECKYNRTYCSRTCQFNEKPLTIKELKEKHKGKTASLFSYVRYEARKWGKLNNVNSCARCGYDIHIEICHIKPISDFPCDSLISEVNSGCNLIGFCRNCHWEFDNVKPLHSDFVLLLINKEKSNANKIGQ